MFFFSLRPHWLSCNLPGKFIYSDTYRLLEIIKYSLICYFYLRRVNIYANDDRCAKTLNPLPSNFLLTQMMAETFPTILLSCYKFTCGFNSSKYFETTFKAMFSNLKNNSGDINIRRNITSPCNSNLIWQINRQRICETNIAIWLSQDMSTLAVSRTRVSKIFFPGKC